MINRIKQKLRSQAGASISFALLLFLVCAVLCSVIITAATASSGRMAGIAENDQRYYAVTSAAELMKSLIEEKTVSIVDQKKTWTNTTYDDEGNVTGTAPATPPEGETTDTILYIVEGKTAAEIDETTDLVTANIINNITTVDSIQEDAAICIKNGTLTPKELTLSELGNNLSVTIQEQIDSDGTITLTIYNKYNGNDESSVGNRYTQVLVFGADTSEVTNTQTETLSTTPAGDNQYTVETKDTETKITTLSWNLTGISTSSEGD